VNFPEPEKAAAAESPERKALIELRKAHSGLRTQFHIMALSCVMLTATLFVIILKQVSLLRRDRDEMGAVVNDYNKVFVPQLEMVRVNLEAYGKTNEAFLPVLRRYFPANSKGTQPGAANQP
jgi:hypothetical protein